MSNDNRSFIFISKLLIATAVQWCASILYFVLMKLIILSSLAVAALSRYRYSLIVWSIGLKHLAIRA
ncbi:hypothetical protein HMPREF1870_01764 [Bacteroidales bacterium KA00344]|nr:hypothetical protein HMPREF1870_01764 [Bacteroidales bacterium KA00344]